MEEPKPRHLVLESHIVAYIGDYLTIYEESIKRLAHQAVQQRKETESSAPPALTLGGSVQTDPKYTASAHNRS